MKTALTNLVNANQITQTSQLVPASPTLVENPSTWMRNGDSPGEIILAVAILISVLIAGIASVIVAIRGLVQTLVRSTSEKTK